MSVYTNRDRQSFVTYQELGRGGEGAVYTVAGESALVAKIYHPAQRTAARQAKLEAMLAHPPRDNGRTLTPPHIALAWPTDLLFAGSQFAGFLMPRIERSPSIFALFNPKLRHLRFPRANQQFLHHTAQNLASAIYALHTAGCLVGDINQKNILVKPNALVTLVDTDSFQVQATNGVTYRCPVGVADYTPPELQGQTLDQVDRQIYHDCFGLGVLIFQLLMEGYHPFTGRPLTTTLRELDQLSLHCLQQGLFPYRQNGQVQPPTDAPSFNWLHPDLQRLFLHCFLVGHSQPAQRPTALAWAQALRKAEHALMQCQRQPGHWYGAHLGHCPYCQYHQAAAPVQHRASRSPIMYSTPRPTHRVPVSPPKPTQQADWLTKIFTVGAFFIPFVAGLLVKNPELIPVVLIVGSLLYRPARRVIWSVLKNIQRNGWLMGKRVAIFLYTLCGYTVQGVKAFWQARTPRFKRATYIMAAILLFWGAMGRNDDAVRLPASPLATPQPAFISP